jgi:hypothetical protein
VMFEFVQRKGKEVKSEIIVEFSASKKCVDKVAGAAQRIITKLCLTRSAGAKRTS